MPGQAPDAGAARVRGRWAGPAWHTVSDRAISPVTSPERPETAGVPSTIGVLVADDEPALREAICKLVAGEEGLHLVGAAADAEEAMALARETRPDVALIDVRMPLGGGARVAREIRAELPDTRVVALSAHEDRATVIEMLKAGAVGYVVKGISPPEVVDTIRRAARGQASLSAEMAAALIETLATDDTERREAAESLRRHEEKLLGLLESSPDAVVIVNANGQIAFVNERTEELFAYRRDELVGRRLELLLPERYRERHVAHRDEYLADPVTRPMGIGLELAGRRKDGTEFPVEISLSSIETPDRRLATAFIRDIGERHSVEAPLETPEGRFAALLESAPDAVAIVDQRGDIVLVNKQTEKLFGYRRDELLGRKVELLLPERFHLRHLDHRASYVADPGTRPMGADLELAGRRRDGTEFAVDISLSSIETEDGPLTTAFIRDVSDRVNAEQLRQKGGDLLEALLEHTPDAVILVNDRGRILFANAQTETLFGYPRAELVGEPIELLLPERFHERHVSHRDSYLAAPVTRSMGAGLDLAGRRKDGSEFPVDISLSAIETEDGVLATAFVRDITERTAADSADALQLKLAASRALASHIVKASEAERARIAADIHDDSIQAITAAGMRLQLLRRSLDDPEQLALLGEFEETIKLSIARLRSLLFELSPPALDREGLAEALRLYLDELSEDGLIQCRLESRLRTQPGEDVRLVLYRIAKEALTNVSKHAGAQAVQVYLTEEDAGYLVRITDDGVGFAPDRLGSVPGHLGLITMRERAELVGGWLRIDSGPQAGTTIEYWVPADGGGPAADVT